MVLGISLLILSAITASTDSWVILVNSEVFFKGNSVTLTGYEDECIDLPTNFVAKAINTNEFCVKAFDGHGCTGNWLSFFPNTFYHHNLTKFQLRFVSVKSCQTAF
ncbi:PREDICTED: uncharacterized protein LOC108556577 [Nicrophorus vespilloides]|uniref:Uncharacterized protein LOC108556577 n=1 Tax=Nicrophorus vespilloides TaxID=110193 RepID=A0ABM1M0Y8_NICVS|nr:PREDICTED: uncharacterized protein LOC108556577 [Nicrophorus vespilloides]